MTAEHCAKFAKGKDGQDDEAGSDDEGDCDSDDDKNCMSSNDEMEVEGT